jgi:DUF177 domain-containing protein
MKPSIERRGRDLGLRVHEEFEDLVPIDEIPEQGMLLHLKRGPSWVEVGVPVLGDIEGWLLLFKIGRDVTADVEGTAKLQLQCGRCLKDFEFPIAMQFRQMYLPLKEEELEDETEVDGDDLGVTFYRIPEIALDELVREEIILAIPLQPLCHEDCPGLCPKCGADLAAGPCSCATRATDPRLSALAGLLDAMNDPRNRNGN